MSEKIVHLFEGQFSSLGKEEPEEDCVGKVADLDVARIEVRVASLNLWDGRRQWQKSIRGTYDKQVVELVPDIRHSRRSHLSNHCIERKARHSRD